jgi:ketosteroid isomerase-like protein
MDAARRANEWYAAWNSRDLEAIVALYSDDIEFSSPFVAALGFASDGVIFGRGLFQAYVELALSRVPDLRFEAIAVCAGARGETVVYRNQSGVLVAESHDYDAAGKIIRANAAYEINPS